MTFRPLSNVPSWRKLALHAWSRPSDPTVYGIVDLDAEPALAHLERLRERTGERVTLTHLVGKAVALAIRERPDVNAILRRGRLFVRDSVDVFFQVAFEDGENLAGAKVERADEKSVADIARELGERATRIRTRKDHPTQKSAAQLANLPPWVTGLAMRMGEGLSYDFGLDLSKWGIPFDAFGSCMITNVGMFGLTTGFAPLFPPGRVPLVVTLGAVHPAPFVVEGRVEVKRKLVLGVAFDHRVLDGYQAGRMAKRFHQVLQDPETELGV